MTAVYGIHSLVREIDGKFAHEKRVQISGASEAYGQFASLCHFSSEKYSQVVIVLPRFRDIANFCHLFEKNLLDHSLDRSVGVVPHYQGYGRERYVNPANSRNQRMYALSSLGEACKGLWLTTLEALAQLTLSPIDLQGISIPFKAGHDYDIDLLVKNLSSMGYLEVHGIEEPSTFALRGGIVDIYPSNHMHPVRLEFFGDTLSSIRFFKAETQLSFRDVLELLIAPAFDIAANEASRTEDTQRLYDELLKMEMGQRDREAMVAAFRRSGRFSGLDMFFPLFRPTQSSLFDYLDERALLVFPKTIATCLDNYQKFQDDLKQSFVIDQKNKKPALPPSTHFLDPQQVADRLQNILCLEYGNPLARRPQVLIRLQTRVVLEGAPVAGKSQAERFDAWVNIINKLLKDQDGRVIILADLEHIERLSSIFSHKALEPFIDHKILAKTLAGKPPENALTIGIGDCANHLWIEEQQTLILSQGELFGISPKPKKTASAQLQNYLSSFKDLKPRDLIVHVTHGIGRYLGMTTLTVTGIEGEFLILEYYGKDRIYLPVDRLNILQRYATGADGSQNAQLDRLGTGSFEKKKSQVRKSVKELAEKLLRISAKRAVAKGHMYSPPGDTYYEFEAAFPYEETEDQLKAIAEVGADLTSEKPMDRLICGDVGFGKTEVALRAAFRCCLEGYQVMILVPTTVLCYQHYRTFLDRLLGFGVKIKQANRFISAKELKTVLKDLESGEIDILIGTHRILSKDIKPRRLGLLVIDEEQRFGVSHKEKLKSLRAGVEVMTLTATPIPRTLHMAMVGLRDISIIATPPQDRHAVKTYVSEFDESLIQDAVRTELARNGQVFFVHNRVQDIEEVRSRIKSLLPEVDGRVAHGQMREHQLEKVIVDFVEQKFPLLICTTIIESGIDMPNVNTLIVNRADRFGLAQLYQLRGRVGRSHVQAYAYFLTPKGLSMSEDAKKRLDVLTAYQELGAGFQIASHDLEIRGAGNLLGGEQSGHANLIGLELYTEMLEQAVAELKGDPIRETFDTEIKLPISAVIPDSYVPHEGQRLATYKKIFSSESSAELDEINTSLKDRFGPPPKVIGTLFAVARLKQLLSALDVSLLRLSPKGYVELTFRALADKRITAILETVAKNPTRYRLAPNHKLTIKYVAAKEMTRKNQTKMLDDLMALIEPIR